MLAAQVVVGNPSSSSIPLDGSLSLELQYSVLDPLPTSPLLFGIQVHYDSTRLQFVTQSGVLADGLVAVEDRLESVSDNDPSTDRVWTASFIDVVNGWPLPSTTLPTSLAILQFKALKKAGATNFNFTADTSLGFDFQSTPVTVTVTQPTFVVTSSDDTPTAGELTLREAISLANAQVDPAIITLAPNIGAVTLEGSSLTIDNDITLRGPRADQFRLTSANADRLFVVNSGKRLALSGITLTGGNVTGDGGAILNNGTLALDSVRLIANTATGSGGAIGNFGSLTIRNSEFAANQAGAGGGAISNASQATIVNSTISDNFAAASGGGIASSGTTILRNNTIALNTTITSGAGVFRSAGATTVRNNIIVGNTIASVVQDISGTVDVTNSIVGQSAAQVIDTSLTFAGNQTRTHALIAGSTAIDQGSNQEALDIDGRPLLSDQRGRARVFGNDVDVGAFELAPDPGFTVTVLDATTINEVGGSSRLSVVLKSPPAGVVVVSIQSDDPTESMPNFPTLVFGPNNWNIPQLLTVFAVDDVIVDGDKQSIVTLAIVPASSDDAFDNILSQSFTITTVDNDAANGFQVDYGDAPSPYPVTLEDDGARHTIGNLLLGATVDGEANGVNSVAANSDGADEDGVVPAASPFTSSGVTIRSSYQITASAAGKLDAWIDFNQDGDWTDAGEQILTNASVVAGSNLLAYNIPAGALAGDTFARFRLSSAGALAPTGAAGDGEVEDYLQTIVDGDSTDGVTIKVVHGSIVLSRESVDNVVRSRGTEMFRALASLVDSLLIQGTSIDDTITIDFATGFAFPTGGINIAGAGGVNKLVLSGEGNIDLTDPKIVVTDISNVELSSSASNKITVDAASINRLSPVARTIKFTTGASAQIDVVNQIEWRMTEPIIVGGRFILTAQNQNASGERIQVDAARPYRNVLQVGDVNNSGVVTASDALAVILELNQRLFTDSSGNLVDPTQVTTPFGDYLDVNGDGKATAADALNVINILFQQSLGSGSGSGEEFVAQVQSDFIEIQRNEVPALTEVRIQMNTCPPSRVATSSVVAHGHQQIVTPIESPESGDENFDTIFADDEFFESLMLLR